LQQKVKDKSHFAWICQLLHPEDNLKISFEQDKTTSNTVVHLLLIPILMCSYLSQFRLRYSTALKGLFIYSSP